MTEKIVQNIYNNLQNWEGKKASEPYPIHKKLDIESLGYDDIYTWITDEYAVDTNASILDAGCGVGYGSIYLAKHFGCSVKGISLSDVEVEKATNFAIKTNVKDKVSFEQKSYDNLKPNSYNLIIAIESVKHTLDIKKTLNSLKNALKPNGTLIIIDDFIVQNTNKKLLDKYAKDWALKELLDEKMFPDFTVKKDFTPYVKSKPSYALTFGILGFGFLNPFMKIAKIMRGGLYLEKLFNQGVMAYYVLEYKKEK